MSTAQRLLLVSCDCLRPRVSLSEPLFDQGPSEIFSAPHPPEKEVLPRPYPRVLGFPPVSVEVSDREPSPTGDLLVIDNCASESCYGPRQGRKRPRPRFRCSSCSRGELRVVKKDCTSPEVPPGCSRVGVSRGVGVGLAEALCTELVRFLEKDHSDLWLGHLHRCLHCPAHRRLRPSLGVTPQLWVAA